MADEGLTASGPVIDLSVEVTGDVDTVWRAVATGPGISAWYVPHTVEERTGGAATASFGPEPEMQIEGRVAVWEPPRRVVFDGGEAVEGLTFEWTVEPRNDHTCAVRLRNSGFGDADPQYDAMVDGWKLFMSNLQLHLEHFAGQTATSVLAMVMWPVTAEQGWKVLAEGLGIEQMPSVGERFDAVADDETKLGGSVVDTGPRRIALLLDTPAAGTGFLTSELNGDTAMVSVWLYLYGPEGAAAAERDDPRWRAWLDSRAPQAAAAPG
ncbi:SRPBCC family protein [Candidatus Poriferisodalis sp.]|uniref:SRPBCC family protein n=1 Tax=Candidatus Poriferisodalis sp. TaxID=3101277 RepID=UPI003B023F95